MENNKHVDLKKNRKLCEKYYPKIYRKIKDFKIADVYLTYKKKRKVAFNNDRKLLIPLYYSILL